MSITTLSRYTCLSRTMAAGGRRSSIPTGTPSSDPPRPPLWFRTTGALNSRARRSSSPLQFQQTSHATMDSGAASIGYAGGDGRNHPICHRAPRSAARRAVDSRRDTPPWGWVSTAETVCNAIDRCGFRGTAVSETNRGE
jgi:hypothetical protein